MRYQERLPPAFLGKFRRAGIRHPDLDRPEDRRKTLIPELLDANGCPDGGEVPFELLTRRFETTRRAA